MSTPTQNAIIRVIERTLGVMPVHKDDLLVEQLGAESTDIVNIVAALERNFQVRIPESSLPRLRSAEDIYEIIRQTSSETKPH